MLRQAAEVDEYRTSAVVYSKYGQAQNRAAAEYIAHSCCGDIDLFKQVLDEH